MSPDPKEVQEKSILHVGDSALIQSQKHRIETIQRKSARKHGRKARRKKSQRKIKRLMDPPGTLPMRRLLRVALPPAY